LVEFSAIVYAMYFLFVRLYPGSRFLWYFT
jgi:hypothetical protein